MGELFECPRCGTRNRVGQWYCTYCSQQFYYNCTRCNSFVDPSFKYCPNCSTSLNWATKPKANLVLQKTSTSAASRKPKYQGVLLVLGAILMLGVVVVAYLSYRFSSEGPQIPVGYESYQELAAESEPYVMAPPNSQYTGMPPYVKGPGAYINLVNNTYASNVSFEALRAFILEDKTDNDLYIPGFRMCGHFAETLHNNAEQAGIRAAVVIVEFEGESAPHAVNAFETTDRGLVYIDCTGVRRSTTDFEEWLYKLFYPIGQDRMAYIVKGKRYGTILLSEAESTQYSYYIGYSQSRIRDEDFFLEPPGIVKSVWIYW